eukprot:403357077
MVSGSATNSLKRSNLNDLHLKLQQLEANKEIFLNPIGQGSSRIQSKSRVNFVNHAFSKYFDSEQTQGAPVNSFELNQLQNGATAQGQFQPTQIGDKYNLKANSFDLNQSTFQDCSLSPVRSKNLQNNTMADTILNDSPLFNDNVLYSGFRTPSQLRSEKNSPRSFRCENSQFVGDNFENQFLNMSNCEEANSTWVNEMLQKDKELSLAEVQVIKFQTIKQLMRDTSIQDFDPEFVTQTQHIELISSSVNSERSSNQQQQPPRSIHIAKHSTKERLELLQKSSRPSLSKFEEEKLDSSNNRQSTANSESMNQSILNLQQQPAKNQPEKVLQNQFFMDPNLEGIDYSDSFKVEKRKRTPLPQESASGTDSKKRRLVQDNDISQFEINNQESIKPRNSAGLSSKQQKALHEAHLELVQKFSAKSSKSHVESQSQGNSQAHLSKQFLSLNISNSDQQACRYAQEYQVQVTNYAEQNYLSQNLPFAKSLIDQSNSSILSQIYLDPEPSLSPQTNVIASQNSHHTSNIASSSISQKKSRKITPLKVIYDYNQYKNQLQQQNPITPNHSQDHHFNQKQDQSRSNHFEQKLDSKTHATPQGRVPEKSISNWNFEESSQQAQSSDYNATELNQVPSQIYSQNNGSGFRFII